MIGNLERPDRSLELGGFRTLETFEMRRRRSQRAESREDEVDWLSSRKLIARDDIRRKVGLRLNRRVRIAGMSLCLRPCIVGLVYSELRELQCLSSSLCFSFFGVELGAKVLIGRWCREYNSVRPHSRLGYCPPVPTVWSGARELRACDRPPAAGGGWRAYSRWHCTRGWSASSVWF